MTASDSSRPAQPPLHLARALVVTSASARRKLIADALESLGISVDAAEGCRDAGQFLRPDSPICLVVTELSLPDGNWCDVLTSVVDAGVGASVVLSTDSADERLWSQAMWRGVYDILVAPYGSDEVRRVAAAAWRAAQTGVRQTPRPLFSTAESYH